MPTKAKTPRMTIADIESMSVAEIAVIAKCKNPDKGSLGETFLLDLTRNFTFSVREHSEVTGEREYMSAIAIVVFNFEYLLRSSLPDDVFTVYDDLIIDGSSSIDPTKAFECIALLANNLLFSLYLTMK